VGVGVDELDGEVAVFVDGRDGEDERFAAEVEADHGVGRVGVGGLEGGVFGGEDAADAAEVVEGVFVFRALFVDGVGVEDAVAVDEGEAVGGGVFGDGEGFLRREGEGGGGDGESEEGGGEAEHGGMGWVNG
jgi:hypothetical protein